MSNLFDDLELHFSEQPIAGWRASNVVLSGEEAWLLGVHHRRRYGVEAHAVCTEYDHPAPASGCHCGLHCWPDRASAEKYRRDFLQQTICQVELAGEVVCHGEKDTGEIEGYRGTYMRTLAVEFSGECANCGRPATALTKRSLPMTAKEDIVVASCWDCGKDHFSCSDLAQKLGTEVKFAGASTQLSWWRRNLVQTFPTVRRQVFASVVAASALFSGFAFLVSSISGEWATAGGLAVATVLALVASFMLRTRFGTRKLGLSLAVAAVALSLAIPLTLSAARKAVPANLIAGVEERLSAPFPNDEAQLRSELESIGASEIRVIPVDPTRSALVFKVASTCFQVSLDTTGESWNTKSQQRVVSMTNLPCPAALPLDEPEPLDS